MSILLKDASNPQTIDLKCKQICDFLFLELGGLIPTTSFIGCF